MRFFADEHEITSWQCSLAGAADNPTERSALLLRLAWHLRQRDTQQAIELVELARTALEENAIPPHQRAAGLARLDLVMAEAAWLFADLEAAQAYIDSASRSFAALGDGIGQADAHWLHAWVAADRGDHESRDAALRRAAASASHVGDALRSSLALAGLARSSVFSDLAAAQQAWGDRFGGGDVDCEDGLATWIHDYRYLVASKRQDIGTAVAHATHMYESALASGQKRRAITAASNIGFDLTRINDLPSALDWMQRGLELARAAGWPAMVGSCLTEMAETLRKMRRSEQAHALLQEALEAMAALPDSRWVALALNYLGDVELDCGRPQAALASFERLGQRADALAQADLQTIASRGCAQALAHLGRIDQALAAAQQALSLARRQDDAYNAIAALRVLADIHAAHRLPGADAGDSPALAFLQEALDTGRNIDGYAAPADLL
ncbi:MAG TPA: tetratricopeptide repeat protein, partial [Arenimonas sp.]|nr:tetratricopeptide repeat protein [Arenimonas sp.]